MTSHDKYLTIKRIKYSEATSLMNLDDERKF